MIDAILLGSAALSALSTGAGLITQYMGNEKQEEAAEMQAQFSREQAAASSLYSTRETEINIASANLSASGAAASGAINKDIIGLQQQIEGQRKDAMELDANRKQLEIIRNQQRARSMGLTAATAQGAQGGSGLQGAYGQISGESGFNLMGVFQNLLIGRNIFDLNEGISNKRIEHTDLETSLATQQAALTTQKAQVINEYQQRQAQLTTQFSSAGSLGAEGRGLSSLGGSLMAAGPAIFSVGSQVAKMSVPPSTPPTPSGSSTSGANSYAYWS